MSSTRDFRKIELSERVYFIVVSVSFLVYVALFFLVATRVNPINYFIFMVVIIFLEGELINCLFKKTILFFRTHVDHSPRKIWVRFERFVFFMMDIGIILLLISYIFFYDLFNKAILIFNRNEVRGGIYFVLFVGLISAILFWLHHFAKKIGCKKKS